MKFKYGSRRRALEYEKALVEYWKKHETFEKSVEQRPADDAYVFYDGPPFISGNPHHGTLLSSIVKDAVPRYWTMRGKRVERRWGWDCHGLPAENFVEKQLGITDRRDIGTKISLETYINKIHESMVVNSASWEGVVDRIGRWVDFKGAYRTMDKDFMESVWWAFKTLYEKGLIYEGEKVLMYDTKFATPVSKTEVTMDNDAYQTVTDPSAYVKFPLWPLAMDSTTYLLAWTTTPWTLPANRALAVNPELDYVEVELPVPEGELSSEVLIVAKKLLKQVMVDEKGQPLKYKVLRSFKGTELVGREYEGLFGYRGKVWGAEFVGHEEGTGIVHIAPAYGEDDFVLAQAEGVEVYHAIDDNGRYLPEVQAELERIGVRPGEDGKIEVWESNKFIAKCLEAAGVVWRIDYIRHEYPFNPRSKQRIMYRAIPSWFFDAEGQKPLMIEENEPINWFPGHLKHGRFEKNIEQAPAWNISRDRFWATAMPVWKGDRGSVRVVGSYDELAELSGVRLEDYHRPWVDEVTFEIDGEKFTRIEKVLDCWFESGSMPFAQLHYPFEHKEKFEANYPADFIVEYVGQIRAWFYYVHAVNTALFGTHAYKNVITTGTVAGNDGRKMSKSLGNFTDPNELMDQYSADALRFLMLSSPLLSGEDFALVDKDVSDVQRKLAGVWNVYDFFTMYAEVDEWDSTVAVAGPARAPAALNPAELQNPLDKWIVSRVHQLQGQVEEYMDKYNLPDAMNGILPFVDDLSNWFVRRSRRRFWKSEDDADKAEAYQTLYYVLVRLALVLAPFVPFMAEELYRNLTGGESVHLRDWPERGEVDEGALADMARCRAIITEGLALRMRSSEEEEQIKVRQPLAELKYGGEALAEFYEQIVADELNVKQVTHGSELWLDKTLTEELKAEGFAREVVRVVQAARKAAGLNVDDRIRLSLSVELAPEWAELVQAEVLAVELVQEGNFAYDTVAKVNGGNITVSLEKV
jgi:isoleucyl-tRNA synthetase